MIGGVDDRGRELVHMAKLCRDEAIRICGPGVPFQDIGATIRYTQIVYILLDLHIFL